MLTLVAVSGPSLTSERTKVTESPTLGVGSDTDLKRARSARAVRTVSESSSDVGVPAGARPTTVAVLSI